MSKKSDWIPGKCLRLLGYGTINKSLRHQLLSMGMTLGVVIRVVRIAPLGSPIQIDLRGAMLALRREDLAALQWTIL